MVRKGWREMWNRLRHVCWADVRGASNAKGKVSRREVTNVSRCLVEWWHGLGRRVDQAIEVAVIITRLLRDSANSFVHLNCFLPDGFLDSVYSAYNALLFNFQQSDLLLEAQILLFKVLHWIYKYIYMQSGHC